MTVSTIFAGMDAWVNEAIPTQVNAITRGLKLDARTSNRKRAFAWFKLPFAQGDEVDVSQALLRFRSRGQITGTRTITARRVTESWVGRSLKWNNAPAVGGSTPNVVVTNTDDGEEIEIDVTALLSQLASGADANYGLRLDIGSGGPFAIYSKEALTPAWRPKLVVTWTQVPDAPEDLSPAGGQVVSAAKPNLGWTVRGNHGETAQAKAQVQVSTTNDVSGLTFDSTLIDLVETEMDLADTAAPSIANHATRYWRVMYEDDAGRTSAWSPWVRFVRETKGTLTIDNPVDGATVEDVSPTVLLDFSGATLAATALYLERVDDDQRTWIELWRRPRKVSTDVSINIPHGYIRRTTHQYRVRARAWDDQDREWRPGDPPFVEAIAEFTFDTNNAIDPVDSIVAQQHADGSPLVDIVITDDDAPDYYSLVVDGDHQSPRIDPADVVTGVGEYTIVYHKAIPRRNVAYEVGRIVNVGGDLKHSKTNPTDTYASTPVGIWLWDPDDPTAVVLLRSGGAASFAWGEAAGVFQPMGAHGEPEAPVRLVQSTRGREGTVRGVVRDNGQTKARTYLTRLRKIWRSGRAMQLVLGEVSIPVVIGSPSDEPLDEPTPAYQVEFQVWQIADFDAGF